MEIIKEDNGWIEIRGPISTADKLRQAIPSDCEKLSISKQSFLSGKQLACLKEFINIRELHLWCDVGRVAMHHLLKLPKLEIVDLSNIRSPGRRMSGFSDASSLKVFRCGYCLKPSDIFAIAESRSIQELCAQGAELSLASVRALVAMPELVSLDLEGSQLDDDMASAISMSTKITSLHIGATEVTRAGLSQICEMEQLKYLDAWNLSISDQDLELLPKLSNLEYLSVGDGYGQECLTAAGVMPVLDKMPSLKRLWLDGIEFTEEDKQFLKGKYERVSITYEPTDLAL